MTESSIVDPHEDEGTIADEGDVPHPGSRACAASNADVPSPRERELLRQVEFLNQALNNMSQGLCMFGPDARLIMCNEQYRRIYRLDAATVKPGCPLHLELGHRKAGGLLIDDPERYASRLLDRMVEGKSFSYSLRSVDGRVIRVLDQPLTGGGWVSTHEDITKRYRAEVALRKNKHVLQSTFDHMAEGIGIFDADLNLVAANRRYCELLGIPLALSRPGTPLADILRHRAERGDYGACDIEKEVKERLERARNAENQRIEAELPNGTIVELRATALPDGGFVRICTDVTERVKAEREIRAAHARLRDAFDVVPEGLALFDADKRFVLWNKRYEEIYSETADQIAVGASFENMLRAGMAKGLVREAVGREEEWLAERLKLHAEANSSHEQHLPGDRWVRIEERRTADGGSVGVRIDITELKHREETLKLLFDRNPVPIIVYDTENLDILAANDAALEFYGYGREIFLSMNMLDIRPANTHDDFRNLVKNLAPMQTTVASQHLKSDGSMVKVDVYSRAFAYDGRPARYATIIDVTDRERAQEERDRSRMFLEQVIDNVPLSITVKDAKDLRFVMLNRTAEQYWGVPRSEVIGKTVAEIFGDELAKLVIARDMAALNAEGPIYLGEHRRVGRGDEDRTYASRRVAVRDTDGKPRYVVGVMEDVTDRRAVERQLQQAQKMEAVGNLTGGIAHDFNNLLAVIIGNLDLLRSDVEGDQGAELKVDAILQEALRAADLTQRLLAFSRRQSLRPSRLDVNKLIEDTARMLTRTLGASVDLVVKTSPEGWPVLVDEPQLEAALVNLAINARDAMPKGGVLTFTTRQLRIGAKEAAAEGLAPSDYMVIEVDDTGTGMPPDVVAKIFEPFFTTKGSSRGTGLGLSMVYGFVKQSGGHIKVESEIGVGTTFTLYLPRAPGAGTAAISNVEDDEADQSMLFANGETILVVDDNAAVRATAVAQLTSLGYYVIEAEGGPEALRILQGPEAVDLLFTDIVMPGGMTGRELAARVRAIRPGLNVLFTSGFAGAEQHKAQSPDHDGELLAKPYRRKELAKAIRKALAGA